jgi:hypothetical protein
MPQRTGKTDLARHLESRPIRKRVQESKVGQQDWPYH